jgi:hypothetical protein
MQETTLSPVEKKPVIEALEAHVIGLQTQRASLSKPWSVAALDRAIGELKQLAERLAMPCLPGENGPMPAQKKKPVKPAKPAKKPAKPAKPPARKKPGSRSR